MSRQTLQPLANKAMRSAVGTAGSRGGFRGYYDTWVCPIRVPLDVG